LTHTSTLSQSFDSGSFISPGILAAVNSSVRAAAEGIIENGGLSDDIERIIDLHADVPSITDTTLGGLVPSTNPDEFIIYDRPEAPIMPGLEMFEPAPAADEPGHGIESAPDGEEESCEQRETDFDSVNVEVVIPDLGTIEQTADSIQEDISLEMPEVSRFNANLFKVKLDTMWFNREFLGSVRLIILIAIIAFVNVILIMYLLS